eukprot:8464950-Pyramimonas_sp.AAC.1
MDSKWTDNKDAVITDIDSTHHHAAAEPWQVSESCCLIKTNDTSSPSRCFYVDLLEHGMVDIYASQGEMLIQESELCNLWPQIEQADFKAIENYVKHECFKPKLKSECNNENFIDATWVRRWVWKEKRVMRSRFCGRGFLDNQKWAVGGHSSTVARVSQ